MSLSGAVAALLAVDDPVEADRLAARVDNMLSALPGAARVGYRAGAYTLEAVAVALTGQRLGALDPARREAVAQALARRSSTLAEALKVPMLFAAGAEDWTRQPYEISGGRPDPMLDCTPSMEWPARSTCDAIVIGSGAGGAVTARTLARAGLNVVVVEEGRRFVAADFRGRPPLERFLELYRDGGGTMAVGRPAVMLPLGRGVGGTTLVNSGTCYRTPTAVQREWRSGWGVRFDLEPLLDEVERTLSVAPQPVDVLGRNGELALLGAERLGWRAAPLRRNAPGCGGCCQCAAGCPRNAKNGVHLSVLPDACTAGARILTSARVVRLLVARGRAEGVRVRRPDGSLLEILAPVVVVSAGATETPGLLRRSGASHPSIGRHLRIHPAVSLAGVFPTPVVGWRGVMQSVGIEELHDEGILIEATSGPPGMSSFVLPGVGRALRSLMNRADHVATLGAMVADGPRGRVYGSRLMRYSLGPEETVRLRRALVAMGKLLFAAGAQSVLTGIAAQASVSSVDDLAALIAGIPVNALHVAGFHPTGTVRMGADSQKCPTDAYGRLRGIRGVWISDASVLPTCPTVNPQLSIMAMALGIAEEVVRTA